MCDICKNAGTELAQFLQQLEEKYPGTTVEGEEVPKGHHVYNALMYAAQPYMQEQVQWAMKRVEARKQQQLLSDDSKVIET